MLTRRRALVAQAIFVVSVVIPLACSTFGEDAATDAGSTSSSEGGTGMDARIDDASIDQKPEGSVPELCIGNACGSVCGTGETRVTYPVTGLAEASPVAGGGCTTYPDGGAPADLLGDTNEGSDLGDSEIRCSLPQTFVFYHGPFEAMAAPYRLVVRAWALHEGAAPSPGNGIVLGAVKGNSTGAPTLKSPVLPTGVNWGVVSYVVDHVPGSSPAAAFRTKEDGDGVTILLDIKPAAGGRIHVSRAWFEVCRQAQ